MQRTAPVALGLFVMFSLTCIAFAVEASDCVVLHYGKLHSGLKGKLVKRTFAGPPNYQGISKGDQLETVWVLALAKALCVRTLPTDVENEAADNIREIQLVFVDRPSYKQIQLLSYKTVIVAGSLFFGQSGHHHTKVLLDVADMRSSQD
jgi:hypothetical protein